MPDLPRWYPDASEAKPAPMPLLRVQAFLNTLDTEEDVDLLADPATARDWLAQAGLIEPHPHGTAPEPEPELEPELELELAREVRESIRGLLQTRVNEHDDARRLVAPLRELAASRRARLTVADNGVLGLENARHDDLRDGLFGLLLIIRGAQEDGTWSRLKVCVNPACRWAFYDRSRNQQGSWCDMAVCGNRIKNRQLRARRR